METYGVNLQAEIPWSLFSCHQSLPGITALHDNLQSVFLVLALATERELIFGFAVWDFVDSEPLIRCTQKAWQVTLDILNVIQLGSKRIIDVNNDDLPVCFVLVEQCHHTQNLDLLDLASVTNQLADLADVQRIIVTFRFRLRVSDIRVLPGLNMGSVVIQLFFRFTTYTGERSVVPEITFVGEAVANKTKFALLDVLFDGVQGFFLGDLFDVVSERED